MKLTHNFRRISRNFSKNIKDICRWFVVLSVLIIFSLVLLFISFGDFLKNTGHKILGDKSSQDIDIKKLVNQAALDISHKNFEEADKHLAIVLEFEPNNVYSIEMKRKLVLQIEEIEIEILKTLKIVEMQPNWREAWIKLADLYEKAGHSNLAANAREKARNLKTS